MQRVPRNLLKKFEERLEAIFKTVFKFKNCCNVHITASYKKK